MQKPSIPKGTRDFLPEEMAKRNYIFDTIRSVFHLYGFKQIETPAMENLSTLMGKYGEEGDKLLFKILNSGDFLSDFNQKERELINDIEKTKKSFLSKIKKANREELLNIMKSIISSDETFNNFRQLIINELLLEEIISDDGLNFIIRDDLTLKNFRELVSTKANNIITELFKDKIISPIVGREKGLRYDLTVPFARFVVMHRNEISFPFKRFQIQPVWRADRPQKGRYREFFQCDVDIVGSDSLLNEVELIQIVDEVYRRLNIRVCLKLNNRKILSGIAEIINEADKIVDITVAIDKLEKIGLDKVNEELRTKGISDEAINKLQPIILLSGSNREKIATLYNVLASSETGIKGVQELEFILNKIDLLNIATEVELDLTLARGLNYYTGAIFEVKALDVQIGSITGGGRYDNLTGVFGMSDVSGVGISFGADRIFDVLNQLDLYPEDSTQKTKVLFVNFGEKEENYILPLLNKLRLSGVNSEIYPEAVKMKKQMSYADANKIPFVVIVGESEMENKSLSLKNMTTGEQETIGFEQLLEKVK